MTNTEWLILTLFIANGYGTWRLARALSRAIGLLGQRLT